MSRERDSAGLSTPMSVPLHLAAEAHSVLRPLGEEAAGLMAAVSDGDSVSTADLVSAEGSDLAEDSDVGVAVLVGDGAGAGVGVGALASDGAGVRGGAGEDGDIPIIRIGAG